MTNANDRTSENKAVVRRFNTEVIEGGDERAFASLMSAQFINHSAAPGSPADASGMLYFFNSILRPAFPDLRVEIHEQIAEGDLVTTRKTLHGTHRGELFGIAATGKTVAIQVIDIVRVHQGRYTDHWGLTTFENVIALLRAP